MADNITADAGSGGAVFATDDIDSVHYPITKLTFGPLDTQVIASDDAGNADGGCQRVVIATDDINLAAIKVSAELLDNAISGAGYNITQMGGTNLSMDEGTVDGGTQRVSLATDDDGVAHLATVAGAVYAEDAASGAADPGVMVLARRTDSPADTSGADLDYEALQMDNGRLWVSAEIDSSIALDVSAATVTVDLGANNDVTIAAGAASIATAEDTASAAADVGVAVMARRTASPADTSGADLDYEMLQMDNGRLWATAGIDQLGGTAISMDEGTVDAGCQRVSLATDDDGVAHLANIAGATHVDDAGFTLGTHRGTMMMGFAGTQSVNANDAAALACETDGSLHVALDAETTKVLGSVIPAAAATGGMSYDMLGIAAADNDKVIKGSAGTLYFISAQSIDATPVYVKLFDAASISPGTTSANLQFMIPANATAANGAGIVLNFGAQGIQFGTGICALVATGFALDDNTAVSANEVIVTFGFE